MRRWRIITQSLEQKLLHNKFSINFEATLSGNLKNLHIFGSIRISASNCMKHSQYLYLLNYCLEKYCLIKITNKHNSNRPSCKCIALLTGHNQFIISKQFNYILGGEVNRRYAKWVMGMKEDTC